MNCLNEKNEAERTSELTRKETNWDGYGFNPIKEIVVMKTKKLS